MGRVEFGPKDADLVLATLEAVTPERSMALVVVRDRQQVAKALDEAERLGVRHIMSAGCGCVAPPGRWATTGTRTPSTPN